MTRYIKLLLFLTLPITFIIFTINGGIMNWKQWNEDGLFQYEPKESYLRFFWNETFVKDCSE